MSAGAGMAARRVSRTAVAATARVRRASLVVIVLLLGLSALAVLVLSVTARKIGVMIASAAGLLALAGPPRLIRA